MMLKKKKNLPCSKYMDTFDYILIGDAEVGKTSLLNRFCYDFYSSYKKKKKRPEIFTISTINDNREFKLQFWDLPMNDDNIEDYKKILQKADGIIFVCSYNKKESLKRILIWNKLLSSHVDMSKKNTTIFVNKNDLEYDVEIPEDDIKRISNEMNTDNYSMSAKTGKGVKKAFGGFVFRTICKAYSDLSPSSNGQKANPNNCYII